MVARTFSVLLGVLLPILPVSAELRGAWIASVYNLNFPSRPGLPADEQKQQIRNLVDIAARAHLNTLMVQVRPEGDALYDSSLEPWSRFLTGVQGQSPGYDPLTMFLAEGHKRGIAIHAWINPYRAAANAGSLLSRKHEVNELGDAVHRIGTALWLDPGDARVRQHVVAVVQDLVERYPVDGVILDDYFYPYPSSALPRGTFPDATTYSRYKQQGGTMAIDEWRRNNVNLLVRQLYSVVKNVRPRALFGISPFGIYTHGEPADVQADLDQYRDLHADPVEWLKAGWVDYLSPQLYWRDGGPQSYSNLLRWWRSPATNPRGVPIYPSIALERLGSGFNWSSAEIRHQIELEQSIGPRSSGGFVLWNIGQLARNEKGIASVIATIR
jgi:uncharacterized lipoprotein YddW (UPF0748 family)